MWDGKSSPLAIIKAKINVILESLCVLEIGQDANQDGDYDFAWLACLSWVNSMAIQILEFQAEVRRKLSKLSREAYASVWQVFLIKISNKNCFESQYLMLL